MAEAKKKARYSKLNVVVDVILIVMPGGIPILIIKHSYRYLKNRGVIEKARVRIRRAWVSMKHRS